MKDKGDLWSLSSNVTLGCGVVVHTCNPCTQSGEGGSYELAVTWNYVVSTCLKLTYHSQLFLKCNPMHFCLDFHSEIIFQPLKCNKNNNIFWTTQMAQWVKCLKHKCEDLSSKSKHTALVTVLSQFEMGGGDRTIPQKLTGLMYVIVNNKGFCLKQV